MKYRVIVAALCVALGLSACETMSVSCTVSNSTTAKKSNSINRPMSANSESDGQSITIAGVVTTSASTASIDATSFTIDVSQSSVTFPATGTATLTIVSSAGSVLAARSFPWVNSGGVLSFSTPNDINTWLQTSGANPSTAQLQYSLDDIAVSSSAGTNTVNTTVKLYGQPVASAGMSFIGGGGCTGKYTCVAQ